MKKKYFLIVMILPLFLQAQVAITEVYYDTPFIERRELDQRAHAGEFIELFNYSTEDIDISGWKLTDNIGGYFFPQGTIIKSNDFLVIAFRADSELNFFDLFSNTPEDINEEKLLYQRDIVLNNHDDRVVLWSNKIMEHNLNKYYVISKVYWRCNSSLPCNRNPVNPGTISSSGGYSTDFNYYLYSFQKHTDQGLSATVQSADNGSFAPATPFGLTFAPQELMELENIQNLSDILYDNYYNQNSIWDGSYTFSCDNSITLINEPYVSDTYIEELCFTFDSSGNQESNQLCSSENDETNNSNSTLTTEEIANKIHVFPNPTTNLTTITWEDEVIGLITDITAFSMNGSSQISINIINSNSAEIYLGSYPTGMYAVKFHLNTGEYVNKIIIKI